ncbi:MAG: MBL fold metallo-hydrolase, partial [Bacteroidaceae bacterium]|nr:MBL fold metallo-hydrolase [Bacteroidaceae bacterium]
MIKVHVLRTGEVRVSPYLPFGGDDCSLLKASGITTPKSEWIWLPVFSFYIEHPRGKFLFDTGWHREMSPEGVYDKRAQIKSLGSWFLYQINQGRIARGEAIDEQLAQLGVKPENLDCVLLSHLDCDHANGLRQVAAAKRILVSRAEMEGTRRFNPQIWIRFQKRWWEGTGIETFDWNAEEGPVRKS